MPGHSSTPKTHFPAVRSPALRANSLSGKLALVTGGGTGLGRAMASAFCQLGASCAIGGRRLPVLQAAAREIEKETGGKVAPIQMDVRDADSVARAADEFVNQFGDLPNIIVNNAAGNFISPTERLSLNAFRTVVDIVLNGTFAVTREFARRLIDNKQGATFLAITTPYARTGSPFVVPSACAKAGVEAMCKSLAAEWGKYGMRFNCIAPGPIFTEGAFGQLDPTGQFADHLPERIPAGRLGERAELANLAAYLVSDHSSWMNGAVIDFDGGKTVLAAGEFSMLHALENEQWDQIEKLLRSAKSKGKAKM